ncbi:MAG: PEP-CTERM sorting domain-containing protein [Planctomycetes bacterium]|nr:PEP-CTERM sorting domain-containing protein [Planctomycetota bacterium]
MLPSNSSRSFCARLAILSAMAQAIFCVVAVTPVNAGTPSFMGLGQLVSGQASNATGVSLDGTVAFGSALNGSGHFEPFRWTVGDGMMGLGYLPGGSVSGAAQGSSGDGSVVVGTSDTGSANQAFRWTQGDGMVGLGTLPGGSFSFAQGTTADGSVVVGGADDDVSQFAYRWTQPDGMVSLGTLAGGTYSFANAISADGSVVVGYGDSPFSKGEAFRWTALGGMEDLGMIAFREEKKEGTSRATAVSMDGLVIVGGGTSDVVDSEAFRWTEETGTLGLGLLPGGNFSEARGVSGDGSIVVGIAANAFNVDEAFYWSLGDAEIRPLREMLVSDFGMDLAGWVLESAQGISSDGLTIVGNGINPAGQPEGWIVHLPEPATLTLLMTGILLFNRRRR